jgi:hypothetical protein
MEIVITGHSTTRNVGRMTLQFTPVSGQDLQTTRLIADVEGAFASWYQSNASRSFGSQFSATLTLNSSGTFAAVKSVSVTASNSSGDSNPTTVEIQ